MTFATEQDAIAYIFASRRKLDAAPRGLDEHTRNPEFTRDLLDRAGLLASGCEYIVVTGSKGKGSIATITAKVLQHTGKRAGLVTSPHLVMWYERIRVNGAAIPQADFLRILSDLKPHIDVVVAMLTGMQYLSPQGIILAIALRWFAEQGVEVAVLEVGRGGRYDDISVVPNRLALFGPIFIEHPQYLGNTVERIAWHKAGIIKPESSAISHAQTAAVQAVLTQEAEHHRADLCFVSEEAPHIVPDGIAFEFEGLRYELPLHGSFQATNARIALTAARVLVPDVTPDDLQRGLRAVRWPGRLHQLRENPAVYVDGAINPGSARQFVESIEHRLTNPRVIIAGVPDDRDVAGVYRVLAQWADVLILTETDIHPNIHFLPADEALGIARQFHDDVHHCKTLPAALDLAYQRAGEGGTVLLSVAQPLVGEAMLIWNIATEQI